MAPPVFIACQARTGTAALNVVSAALDADPRTAGAEVRFAPDPAGVAREIRAARERGAPALVGWSFYSTDFAAAAADLARVRQLAPGPGVLHVAGGVHASAEPRATLAAGFELVAVGEGERTIIGLFDALARGADPRGVPGTAHLDANGALTSAGPAARRPLDEFPACNLRYGKWNALEITRGCVYACGFCQTPFMFQARFRHRSVANVRMHVAAMARERVLYVRFVTPTALSYGAEDEGVNLPAVEELLAAVKEAIGPGGKVYFGTFPSEVRPEHVTPEALAILARYVENRTLVIGGQSGSDRMLTALKRGHGVAEVERAVATARAAGFAPDVDLIFGLPGEMRADREQTVALAERLVAQGARIHSHSFMPLPGTPLAAARPTEVEPEIGLALARLESRHAMYGQWRRQAAAASALAARRAGGE
ncbi:MAG: TIGR04013 family B12-binding domain/radical SAM domain-containing protein [Planctomycetes bacterium]|nr:TIGR04013 family B12-binding domain/radical SAM domain-containing protein [Planctomycetota bacterium]